MFNEGSIKVILGLIINKFFIYKSIFFQIRHSLTISKA